MARQTFSDEQLVAYLDGEADHAPIAEIDAALSNDPALVARLEALRVDIDRLAASFQSALNPSKKPPLALLAANQNRWIKQAAAASLIGVLVGFGAANYSAQPAQDGWKDYVAAYHFLYTPATLSAVENTPALQQQELDRVGAVIGKQVQLATLSDLPKVDYKRAQILGFNDQPLLQLTFITDDGAPIALCILRSEGTSDQPVQLSQMEGMSAASWQNGGYDYLLIGGQDEALIQRLAADVTATAI